MTEPGYLFRFDPKTGAEIRSPFLFHEAIKSPLVSDLGVFGVLETGEVWWYFPFLDLANWTGILLDSPAWLSLGRAGEIFAASGHELVRCTTETAHLGNPANWPTPTPAMSPSPTPTPVPSGTPGVLQAVVLLSNGEAAPDSNVSFTGWVNNDWSSVFTEDAWHPYLGPDRGHYRVGNLGVYSADFRTLPGAQANSPFTLSFHESSTNQTGWYQAYVPDVQVSYNEPGNPYTYLNSGLVESVPRDLTAIATGDTVTLDWNWELGQTYLVYRSQTPAYEGASRSNGVYQFLDWTVLPPYLDMNVSLSQPAWYMLVGFDGLSRSAHGDEVRVGGP